MWILSNWATWKLEEPEFLTEGWITLVPEEWMVEIEKAAAPPGVKRLTQTSQTAGLKELSRQDVKELIRENLTGGAKTRGGRLNIHPA